MYLNEISPDDSRPKRRRVGRGIGSGFGKTCGRGHKGQKSRAGGYHKVGFEGGQMPLQRRLPKVGFNSRTSMVTDEVRLSELNKLDGDVIDLDTLKQANIILPQVKSVKVIASGTLTKAVVLKGLRATKGARQAIEGLGGTISE